MLGDGDAFRNDHKFLVLFVDPIRHKNIESGNSILKSSDVGKAKIESRYFTLMRVFCMFCNTPKQFDRQNIFLLQHAQ